MEQQKKLVRAPYLFAANGLYYISMALYSPFISAFFTSRGMTPGQIGILMSVSPLCALLIQPFWARLSDRTGKRRLVIQILCVGCAIAILNYVRAKTFAAILFSIICYAFFYSAMLPLTDALVVQSAKESGVRFSMIRLCGTLSYAAIVFPVGFLIHGSYNILFYLTSASFVVTFFLYFGFRGTDQEPIKTRGTGQKLWDKDKKMRRGEPLFHTKLIICVLLSAFILMLCMNYNFSFMGVLLLQKGYAPSILGVLNCISALSEVPILLVSDKLMKRFSSMQLLFLAMGSVVLRLLLTSTGIIPLVMLGQATQGFGYMVSYMVCVTFIAENVDENRISEGQSMLTLVQNGLGAILGSLLGGALAEKLGIVPGYYVTTGFLVAVMVLVFFLNRRITRQEAATKKTVG